MVLTYESIVKLLARDGESPKNRIRSLLGIQGVVAACLWLLSTVPLDRVGVAFVGGTPFWVGLKGHPKETLHFGGPPKMTHPFAVSSCLPICLSFGPPCGWSLELERPDTFETIGRRLSGGDIRGPPRATQVSHNSQGRTQFSISVWGISTFYPLLM